MRPLEVYFLNIRGRGINTPGIGTVYSAPLYFQRGHGKGNFFGRLFRWVRPILWRGGKAVGHETLRTGGKILTDIAERSLTDSTSSGDIVSKLATKST